jgi:hypothetical protein
LGAVDKTNSIIEPGGLFFAIKSSTELRVLQSFVLHPEEQEERGARIREGSLKFGDKAREFISETEHKGAQYDAPGEALPDCEVWLEESVGRCFLDLEKVWAFELSRSVEIIRKT